MSEPRLNQAEAEAARKFAVQLEAETGVSVDGSPVTGDQLRRSPVFAALTPEARDTVAENAEYRRLQLMGVAPEVIAPLLDYVAALNAKQLAMAIAQYNHLLVEGDVTEEHRREHALRYGWPKAGESGPGPMSWRADCETCVAGEGFAEPRLREYFAVDPAATGAGKYVQVVAMEPHWKTGEIEPRSVHSVVNKATGEVSKSAGWKKGPAKSTSKARKGQPLVVFTLTDPEQCAAVFARMDVYGSYLYSK